MTFFGSVADYFVTLGKAIGGQLVVDTVHFLKQFVHDDLGVLAVDAVNYIESTMAGAPGLDKRNAAVAKLKADAITAGHDAAAWAESEGIWLVETALQAVTQGIAK